jgi:hypothetical protein
LVREDAFGPGAPGSTWFGVSRAAAIADDGVVITGVVDIIAS